MFFIIPVTLIGFFIFLFHSHVSYIPFLIIFLTLYIYIYNNTLMFFIIPVTLIGFLIFLFHSHVSYIPFFNFF